jgi:hypothetical protein
MLLFLRVEMSSARRFPARPSRLRVQLRGPSRGLIIDSRLSAADRAVEKVFQARPCRGKLEISHRQADRHYSNINGSNSEPLQHFPFILSHSENSSLLCQLLCHHKHGPYLAPARLQAKK